MRRQVYYRLPNAPTLQAGIARQTWGAQVSAMMSIQPVKEGRHFVEYLTGKKVSDYFIAICETELPVSEEGKGNGALILFNGKTYEVVGRNDWQNSVMPHYTYLIYCMSDRAAKSRVGA